MDANKVLAVLKQFESAHDEKAYDWCPCCMEVSGHKADCAFVALTAAVEREAQGPGENDWQSTVGMFAGDAEMQAISEQARSVREAHKEPTDAEMLDWLQAKREQDGSYTQWCIDLDPEEPLLSFAMDSYKARHGEFLSMDVREAIRAAMKAEHTP